MSKNRSLIEKLKDERQALLDRKSDLFQAIRAAEENFDKQSKWIDEKVKEYDSVLALVEAGDELEKQREEGNVPF